MNRILLLCLLHASLCQAATPPFSPAEASAQAGKPAPVFADTIDPTITCPASVTITLPPGKCDTVYNYQVSYFDNEPGVVLVQGSGLPSGSVFPIGVTLNLFVALDMAGNTSTCSFSVQVNNFANNLSCENQISVKLDADCLVTVPYSAMLTPGANGCPANFTIEVDKTPPFGNGPWVAPIMGVADIGKTYQFRVTDQGTGNKCWGNGTVVDSMPPHMSCDSIVTSCAITNLSPSFLKDSLGFAAGVVQAFDNCSNLPITPTFIDQVQNLPCQPSSNSVSRIVTRRWTATDASNNKSTCTQIITLKRLFSDVRFPADTSLSSCENTQISQSAGGLPYLQIGNYTFPLLQSFACDFDANYYDTLEVAAGCDGYKLFRRTWKVFDLCAAQPSANPLVGVQLVELQDVVGPSIACPADVTLNLSTPGCSATVNLPDFIVSDNCSRIHDIEAFWTINGLTYAQVGTLTNFAGNNLASTDTLAVLDSVPDFPVGVTVVVYVATDDCGNTGICQFNLHVWDSTPPLAVCDTAITVYMGPSGSAILAAGVLDNGSSDACNALTFKAHRNIPTPCQANDQFYDELHFCCADIGDTVSVTLRVYDVLTPAGNVAPNVGAGHFSECMVPVRILDTLPPGCVAPPAVTVNCENFDAALPYGTPNMITCSVDSTVTNDNYALFDTSCTRGTIVRTFKTFRDGLPGNSCSQTITVNYKQDYFIKFPNDVIVTSCSGSGLYGEPEYFGLNCENMQATFEDNVFNVVPDACYKIERTWTIVNLCTFNAGLAVQDVPNPQPSLINNAPENLIGPIVSAQNTVGAWAPSLVKINPTDPLTTNFSAFWSLNSNGYTYKQIIKVIDTQDPVADNCSAALVTVQDQSVNHTQLWNETYWYDDATASNNLAESAIDSLSFTATDACSGPGISIRYLLYLDLDGDGIQETVVNSANLPGLNNVYFGNAQNVNFSGGIPRAFDERTVPANQKYAFGLQTTTSGNKKTARIAWNTQATPNVYVPAQLPYGSHKIKWYVDDACGNELICTVNFIIRDGKDPDISCKDTTVMEIPGTQGVSIQTADVLEAVSDNATPLGKIKLGLRKGTGGTGFPYDGNGNPVGEISFSCADTGLQTIQLWALDLAGNTSFCAMVLHLTDVDSSCTALLPALYTGRIQTESLQGVNNVKVALNITHPSFAPSTFLTLTDSQGNYTHNAQTPSGAEYVLRPKLNADPLNGVTTLDLVAMSKHILAIEPLNSPYKIIAADINKNNSVTTIDIVEARKLILGINDSFPQNDSWRFIDKAFVFPNPMNPFQAPFPETIGDSNQTMASMLDFVGVKVGDMNESADPGIMSNQNPDDRNQAVFLFDVEKVGAAFAESSGALTAFAESSGVEAGETFTAHFRATETVLGYQFTLNFKELELLDVVPGPNMSAQNFGIFPGLPGREAEGVLTTSYDAPLLTPSLPAEFSLTFRAAGPGRLSDLLHISSRITKAEAYRSDAAAADVALRFDGGKIVRAGLYLHQNKPNPFHDKTTIGFYLPQASRATLRIYDGTGRILFTHTADYQAGEHFMALDDATIGASGVLYYKLETEEESAVRKMVKQ